MAKPRPPKKKRVKTRTILLGFALAAIFIAAMAVVAWRLFPPPEPLPSHPPSPEPSLDLDQIGKRLAREAEAALVRAPLTGQGRLVSSGSSRGATGKIYHVTWSGYSDTALVLAEKAVEDAWRGVDDKVRVGASYPESSPSGERIRMVAGMTENPLIELTLKLEEQAAPAPPPKRPEKPMVRGRHHGRIALIIDDIGNDLAALDALLSLPVTVTFSVLPDSLHREEALERLTAAHAPVMLHLPMQPLAYPEEDPGPDALLVGMDRAEIEKRVAAALDAVPTAEGVNNHMGSAFTTDREGMAAALEVIKSRGLFFIDSRTTPQTIGFALARELGMPAAERKVFLDHEENIASILAQLRALAEAADKEGTAVGIGHPYPETIAALQKAVPELVKAGYVFVPAREAVK
ncbi:MAG TPA: divergent polysaccharide deacetylase family protein [bacterium]|nr:divergent polysaccharide deacetylase family protein [bacterium]